MNINVLFVDDEPDVINGLKRMLFSMKREWGMFFALSGAEALEIMEKYKIDVVVSDMRMPGMDGTELLNITKQKHPEILRIILSGYQDEIKILRSTLTAHQFLLKPCNAQTIKETIEKTFSFRAKLENQKLIDIINGIGELPSIPELYLKVEEEIAKPDFSFEKVKKIISGDPAMTAKILQTVNSGFFGLPRRVTDLLHALSFMGVNTIKSIVLYLQTFSDNSIPPKYKGFCQKLGEHSLKVAQIAKIITSIEKMEKNIVEDAFTSGILHDIGKLILLKLPDFYDKQHELIEKNKISYEEAEEAIIGINHQSIGAYLLGICGLPDLIIDAVAYHHEPMKANNKSFSVLTAIHVANAFEEFHEKEFDENKFLLDLKYLEYINLKYKLPFWWNETKKITGGKNE
jgi:putative nucleotidyltransferase with HDIG domain